MMSLARWTYGSNSAGSRDGTDGARALSEGVPEHINRGLYVPRVVRKTIAIDLQLCGEEIRWREGALFWSERQKREQKTALAAPNRRRYRAGSKGWRLTPANQSPQSRLSPFLPVLLVRELTGLAWARSTDHHVLFNDDNLKSIKVS